MKTGKNHNKPPHIRSRKDFFDWLVLIPLDVAHHSGMISPTGPI
ncbi:hypothetical protein ACF1BQ_029435 [Bradyrhizobium sp. RDT10]